MLLHISSEGVPIYQQIVDQIQFRIISGQLGFGDELPTIHELAESSRVNPKTITRAYQMLETEGLVEECRTGRMLVAQSTFQETMSRRKQLLTTYIDKLVIQSEQLGFSINEVIEQIQKHNADLRRKDRQS